MTRLQPLEFRASKVQAIPLYSQLSSIFRDLIAQEEWPVGKPLPGEAELARRFGVSVGTTRKALEALEEAGWVTRKQGRGTFVADPAERQFDRFCRMVTSSTGRNVLSECDATVLQRQTSPASDSEAIELQIPSGAMVLRLTRRFDRKGKPFMLEEQVLRADVLPDFETINDLPLSFYKLLLLKYGISVERCDEKLEVVHPSPEVSRILGLAQDACVLHTKRSNIDAEGRVIDLIERWCDPTDVAVSVTLS